MSKNNFWTQIQIGNHKAKFYADFESVEKMQKMFTQKSF
jgi:hypothetical protein